MRSIWIVSLITITAATFPALLNAQLAPGGGGAGPVGGNPGGNRPVEQGDDFGDFEAPLPGFEGRSIDQFVQGDNPLTRYFSVIITFVTALIVGIAVIAIVVSGYFYMTAGGDDGRIKTSKTIFSGALLGIGLALGAYLLLNTISPQFASELQDPVIPGQQGQ